MAGGSTRLVPVYLSFPRNGLRALSSPGSGVLGSHCLFHSHGLVVPFASFGRGAPEAVKASFSLSKCFRKSQSHSLPSERSTYPTRQIIRLLSPVPTGSDARRDLQIPLPSIREQISLWV